MLPGVPVTLLSMEVILFLKITPVFISTNENKISFDMIVKTMLQTGKDLKETYRETSLGGLAKEYKL